MGEGTRRVARGLLFGVCVWVTVPAGARDLTEYRFSSRVQWAPAADWRLEAKEDLRFTDDDDRRFYYRATDTGVLYGGLAPWLDVGLSFKATFAENTAGETLREDRPYVQAILQGPLCGALLSSRVRAEYRDHETRPDFWSFKDRLRILWPLQIGTWELGPYLSDEVFLYYNEVYDGYKSHRAQVGCRAAPPGCVRLDGYYFWERGRGFTLQAVGASLSLGF